jgi:hypothetical protein
MTGLRALLQPGRQHRGDQARPHFGPPAVARPAAGQRRQTRSGRPQGREHTLPEPETVSLLIGCFAVLCLGGVVARLITPRLRQMSWSELERLVEQAESDPALRRALSHCRSRLELVLASQRLGFAIDAHDLKLAWRLHRRSCTGAGDPAGEPAGQATGLGRCG